MSFEWEQFEIQDLCTVCSSKRVFAHDYVESGIPFFASKDVIDKAFGLFAQASVYISTERFSELAQKNGFPQRGDLLLSSVGNRSGIPYVVSDEGEFYFKDGNILWFKDFNCLHSEFLCYWLKSPLGQNALNSIMIGSAQKALTISGVQKLKIKVPPYEVQDGIVSILNGLDNRISLLRETNTTLEAIAQTLFKSWFVNFDPVKAKAEGRLPEGMDEATTAQFPSEFEESALGLIPKGWRVGMLGNELKITYGKNLPTNKLLNYGFPVFGGNGQIGFFDKYIYEERQILISCRGAASGKVNQSLPKSFITNNSLVLETGKGKLMRFGYLKWLMKNSDLSVFVTGSAQPQVTIDNIKGFKMLLPDVPILDLYESISGDLEDRIEENEKQSQTLTTLRDTLLPRLISGQLRLNQAQEIMDEVGA